MAKEKEDVEVFGEDFNILEGIEDIFGEDADESQDVHVDKDDEQDDDPVDGSDGGDDEEVKGNEDEEQHKSGEDTDSDDTNSSSSPLIPYAKYLKEEGILPNFDLEKFDGSIDGLRDGMYSEILAGVEQYKNTLPEPVKNLINNYQDGVPMETLLSIDSERVKYTSLTDEDMASEDVQKRIIREYLSATTRFSKEKIEKEINRFSDLQELEDEAKAALPELIQMQNDIEKQAVEDARKHQIAAEEARKNELIALQNTLKDTKEIVPGVAISDAIREKIFKNLTTPVAYNEAGQPLNKLGLYRTKNPVQTEIVLSYIFEITNEFKDWTAINKGAKRQVISDIERAAKSLDGRPSGRQPVFQSESKKAFLREVDDFIGNNN